jgi:hypothetical protein
MAFTVTASKIVAIDMLADPQCLHRSTYQSSTDNHQKA